VRLHCAAQFHQLAAFECQPLDFHLHQPAELVGEMFSDE
jgi:hypothetical protein